MPLVKIFITKIETLTKYSFIRFFLVWMQFALKYDITVRKTCFMTAGQ